MDSSRQIATLLVAAFCTAYAGTSEAAAAKATVALVSYSTCSLVNGKLKGCTIGNKVLTPPTITTAVPLRTRLEVKQQGNCQTFVPRELTIELPGELPIKFHYLQQSSIEVRHRDGRPAKQLVLKDTTAMNSIAGFHPSCTISVELTINEPDVRSTFEAQNIIKGIAFDLNNKQAEAERYKQLMLFGQAYGVMKQLSKYLLGKLTSGAMLTLTEKDPNCKKEICPSWAETVLYTLFNLAHDGTGLLSTTDRSNLQILLYAVSSLDSADSWQNKDKSTKTLMDLMNTDSQQILKTVTKIMQEGDIFDKHERDYKTADLAAKELEKNLALAKVQLAAWLQK